MLPQVTEATQSATVTQELPLDESEGATSDNGIPSAQRVSLDQLTRRQLAVLSKKEIVDIHSGLPGFAAIARSA
jgi:hypothetical protein